METRKERPPSGEGRGPYRETALAVPLGHRREPDGRDQSATDPDFAQGGMRRQKVTIVSRASNFWHNVQYGAFLGRSCHLFTESHAPLLTCRCRWSPLPTE